MDALILLPILVVAYVLGAPIYLLVRQRKDKARIDALEGRLATALDDLGRLQRRAHEPAKAEPDTGPEEPAAEEGEAEDAFAWMDDAPESEAIAALEADTGEEPPEPVPAIPAATSIPVIARQSARPDEGAEPPTGPSVEEQLASQWLIWVGAVAVALSAVFLFRYAVDQGWLTPLTRVILGLLLGGFLLSMGEWAKRHPVAVVRRAVNPDYVPPALSGSGIFAVYVSLYAAHAMFGLLTPTTAFIVLGLTSYSALVLSLRQGPFVALVGLLAGYLVPALVDTPTPEAVPLFVYLFVLTAGCLLVMVWRKWWWFSYLTLSGALVWPLFWLAGSWSIGDQGVLETYALGLAVLFALLSTSLPIRRSETPIWRWAIEMLADTSGLGFTLSGLLLLLLAAAADFNSAAFTFIGLYGAAALLMATRRAALESLLLASAAIAVAAVLFWPAPVDVTPITAAQDLPERGFGPFMVPPEYRVYATALWSFAVLFGAGAFVGMRWGRTPALWAGIASLLPLLFFVIGYWRIGALETDISWAMVGGALAILAASAAAKTRRWVPGGDGSGLATALFAAGATAALALAFTCILREAWLTVALAFETLALAWIWSRVQLPALRTIATAVTLVVIVRLVANPMVLDYEGQVLGVFGWVLYGYGLPAIATFLASRIFARSETDLAQTLLEIAAAGFAFLMVGLQLKLWTSGDIYTPRWTLLDQAVQTIWWIAAAGLLLYEAQRGERPWTYLAGIGLILLSLLSVFLVGVVTLSPLVTNEAVGWLPLINLLGLAYLVPALMFFAIGSGRLFQSDDGFRQVLLGASGFLVFVYITLETRRAFWGTFIGLSGAQPTNAEFYAYSAVWIVFALCLLFIGILRVSVPLRYASLAVLMVTVAKVFLFDMSDLTGLFRVASFLGLGLTLIGIGRVYQRFVFAPEPGGTGKA
ncbi:MAG: DUF2339 domain-containing protein [Rhodobacteraceae bacterium]|nr:DUF2339 domain-containing protein [Paracoccaceae bacterium]